MAGPALRVGLTGGIGSGKSTAAALLQKHGAALIDTDAISRSLTAAGGAAIGVLRARFGAACLGADGALDRQAMRALAFANPGVRRELEALLHPLIDAEAERQAAAAAVNRGLVFDVPLLVETGHWRSQVDRVLVIDCSAATQLRRVGSRGGWTPEVAERVIAQQAPRPVRRAAADAVIDNDNDDLARLRDHVAALWRDWFGPR